MVNMDPVTPEMRVFIKAVVRSLKMLVGLLEKILKGESMH